MVWRSKQVSGDKTTKRERPPPSYLIYLTAPHLLPKMLMLSKVKS